MSLKNKPLKCALAVILIYAIGSNNQAMADCIEPEFGGIKNYGLVAKKSDMRELMDEMLNMYSQEMSKEAVLYSLSLSTGPTEETFRSGLTKKDFEDAHCDRCLGSLARV